jgi:hypothetical protein
MFIDRLKIRVEIDHAQSNVPIVADCSVSQEKMQEHGPFIRSALPKYERKMDFLGGWSSQHYQNWKLALTAVDSEYGHECGVSGFGLQNVATDPNVNLSSAQKELLLWHWKLGISMQQIQELMCVVEMEEPDGKVLTMDRVICPRIRSAATYPIPICKSCQLAGARQRKQTVVKSKAIPEETGAL